MSNFSMISNFKKTQFPQLFHPLAPIVLPTQNPIIFPFRGHPTQHEFPIKSPAFPRVSALSDGYPMRTNFRANFPRFSSFSSALAQERFPCIFPPVRSFRWHPVHQAFPVASPIFPRLFALSGESYEGKIYNKNRTLAPEIEAFQQGIISCIRQRREPLWGDFRVET